jgi:hypothetical protein
MSYTLIERRELTASADSIEFTSIPQFYTDILILCSLRERDTNSYTLTLGINGSTNSNLSARILQGNGTSAVSATTTSPANLTFLANPSNATANTFGNAQIYIPNYTSSNNKSFSIDSVTELNQAESYQRITAGLWSNTAPITSLTITGGLAIGSSISLYGINRQQAIGAPKAVGGNITFANGYWVHTFNASGTFSALENLNIDSLVIGGGGGGGGRHAGGGGAGGFRTTNTLLPTGLYSVVVGSGGIGAFDGTTNGSRQGAQGSSSAFYNIVSAGGGGGAGAVSEAGGSGGSGGGGTYQGPAGSGNIPATVPSQGNNGGLGIASGGYVGGGGGGAGAAGGAGSGRTAGSGGIGLSSSITGTSTFRAAGGGGGAWTGDTAGVGGLGGGGNGVGNAGAANAQDGSVNTGSGGGGGGGEPSRGGNGGSGIVVIRYPAS